MKSIRLIKNILPLIENIEDILQRYVRVVVGPFTVCERGSAGSPALLSSRLGTPLVVSRAVVVSRISCYKSIVVVLWQARQLWIENSASGGSELVGGN